MDENIHLYEGMFLMSQDGGSDLGGALAHISDLLGRIEAEIVLLQKWDDRRLAYPIKGQKRGLYLLAYFKADASRVVNLERDCNLSESIARVMVLRADHIGEAELEVARKGAADAKTEAALRDAPSDGDTDDNDADDRADVKAAATTAAASDE